MTDNAFGSVVVVVVAPAGDVVVVSLLFFSFAYVVNRLARLFLICEMDPFNWFFNSFLHFPFNMHHPVEHLNNLCGCI